MTSDELHQTADLLRQGINRVLVELEVADEVATMIDAAADGLVGAEELQAAIDAFNTRDFGNPFSGVLLACEAAPSEAVN
jgi:hypothetical protein